MPTFLETWDVTKPAGSRDVSLGDDDIRELKRALTERLGEDHEFQTDETGNNKVGYHKKVTLTKRSADPTVVTDAGILYTKDVGSGVIELFYEDAAGRVIQLTNLGSVKALSKEVKSWFGTIAELPTGWYLCNGSGGRPDLRDKFVVGATQDSGGVAVTNVEGALAQSASPTHNHAGFTGSTALDATQIPAHTHTFTIPTRDGLSGGSSNILSGNGSGSFYATGVSGTTGTGSGGGAGHDHTIAAATAIPPYYALALISQYNV